MISLDLERLARRSTFVLAIFYHIWNDRPHSSLTYLVYVSSLLRSRIRIVYNERVNARLKQLIVEHCALDNYR